MSDYKEYFKKRHQVQSIKKKTIRPNRPSLRVMLGTGVLVLASGAFLYCGDEEVLGFLRRVEIRWIGAVSATEDKVAAQDPKTAEKSTETKVEHEPVDSAKSTTSTKGWSDEEVGLFKKLEEKKKELDQKEESLTKLEEELQKKRDELEKRLGQLDKIRSQIAEKLEGKVAVDKEKVDSLVRVYSSMKPSQAAKIIESINEDLAVEIMGKMKNKNTAAILNLMEAEKAKKLTERFAGYSGPASEFR